MNFKPTKLKVGISIVVIVIWYILILFLSVSASCLCKPCPENFRLVNCEEVFVFDILPDIGCSCNCSCPEPTTVFSIIIQLFTLLFPGLLVYFIWSLVQNKKNIKLRKIENNKKRKG